MPNLIVREAVFSRFLECLPAASGCVVLIECRSVLRRLRMANRNAKRGLNVGVGVVVGVVIGVLIDNIGMGIGIGLAIGIALSLVGTNKNSD